MRQKEKEKKINPLLICLVEMSFQSSFNYCSKSNSELIQST